MLHMMRSYGKKVFLLTNSEFYYTNAVMSYMLDGMMEDYKSWRDYWDVMIVNAKKPLFFSQGMSVPDTTLS